jgi:hypothetical protein
MIEWELGRTYEFDYLDPFSSGPLEGINNKIGVLQRRAYGYRNYEHFKLRQLTLHYTKFVLNG